KMTLWIDELGPDPERSNGQVLIRRFPATLKLAVHDFPPEYVQSVEWRFEGEDKARAFEAGTGRGGAAAPARFDRERGERTVRVTLRTKEALPQAFDARLEVRYQPPPPAIQSKSPNRLEVDKAAFRFQAEVLPAPGEKADVRLVHKHNEKAVTSSDEG